MDKADQIEAPADSWMGWSHGRWDGDTLVIDTKGYLDTTWFDRAGNYHSDALHTVERITPRSADTLLLRSDGRRSQGVHAALEDEHAALPARGAESGARRVSLHRVCGGRGTAIFASRAPARLAAKGDVDRHGRQVVDHRGALVWLVKEISLMARRSLSLTGCLAVLMTVSPLGPSLRARPRRPPPKPMARPPRRTCRPKTADGQPDICRVTGRTPPTSRSSGPVGVTKEFYTPEEMDKIEAAAKAKREDEQTGARPPDTTCTTTTGSSVRAQPVAPFARNLRTGADHRSSRWKQLPATE